MDGGLYLTPPYARAHEGAVMGVVALANEVRGEVLHLQLNRLERCNVLLAREAGVAISRAQLLVRQSDRFND